MVRSASLNTHRQLAFSVLNTFTKQSCLDIYYTLYIRSLFGGHCTVATHRCRFERILLPVSLPLPLPLEIRVNRLFKLEIKTEGTQTRVKKRCQWGFRKQAHSQTGSTVECKAEPAGRTQWVRRCVEWAAHVETCRNVAIPYGTARSATGKTLTNTARANTHTHTHTLTPSHTHAHTLSAPPPTAPFFLPRLTQMV